MVVRPGSRVTVVAGSPVSAWEPPGEFPGCRRRALPPGEFPGSRRRPANRDHKAACFTHRDQLTSLSRATCGGGWRTRASAAAEVSLRSPLFSPAFPALSPLESPTSRRPRLDSPGCGPADFGAAGVSANLGSRRSGGFRGARLSRGFGGANDGAGFWGRCGGGDLRVSKDKHPLTTRQKIKKSLLTRWRKEPEDPEKPERLIVYEYMENGTLQDLLRPDDGSSMLSPVTVSWKMRINVLLGVSHAIEHLHCHANPPIIHRDIKSANILFDASWVPRLSDFGSSVVWDMATQEEGMEVAVIGTFGYLAPEYHFYGLLKPASDVYSLGVVMLEVLTGKSAYSQLKDDGTGGPLTDFALPIIEVGNIEELLDRRPVPEPTPWQLQAMKRVAQIAWCCGKLDAKDRPVISDIVANLEMAYELLCRDEHGSVDEPCLWPFVEQVDLPLESPHSRSSSSAGYHSELESEVLEEGR
ncbi:serine/threonine-protein kinase-like protein CR4 [Triticum urartu]|nr:serine/threonine-protein kinase-like protein CR4 [Triticum urartu]